MIAVITGSTGLVGNTLIHKLLQSEQFTKVISLARRSTGISDPKLKEVITTDLTAISSLQNELKGDVFFCCLGTTIKTAGSQENFKKVDHDAVVEFGKIAKAQNPKSFVVISASGASKFSKIFYSKVKGQMEEDLKKLELNHLVIFRPGLLVGERQEFRLGEKSIMLIFNCIKAILPTKTKKRIVTSVDILAEQMLSAGLNPPFYNTIIEAKHIGAD